MAKSSVFYDGDEVKFKLIWMITNFLRYSPGHFEKLKYFFSCDQNSLKICSAKATYYISILMSSDVPFQKYIGHHSPRPKWKLLLKITFS